MTAAWFRSTSGGDNPPYHVVGHATAAQRYQAAFVILAEALPRRLLGAESICLSAVRLNCINLMR